MKRADEFLTAAAATFKERNAEYGDNWKMVGEVMKGLFPSGVTLNTPDDWNRMHILLLKVVKLTRYTVNWNKGGHADSIHDDTVYGAMLESIDEEIRSRPKPDALGLPSFYEAGGSDNSGGRIPCNNCSHIAMCTQEHHCDLITNGYR